MNFEELRKIAQQARLNPSFNFLGAVAKRRYELENPTPESELELSLQELDTLLDNWALDDIDDDLQPEGELKSVELWPYFDLATSFKKATYGQKSSSPKKPYTAKKVILVNQYRNAATLTATRLAIASQGSEKQAGFSSTRHSAPLLPGISI
ncbi:MAG: hypothetical protein Q8L68_03780 [Methylococcales bacterium]|nr:hypothetical protein [Methylococcales bacterium]